MLSVSPEIYEILLLVSHWLFVFFAFMLFLFALAWHHADRREKRDRFKNLPGAGTVGELVVLSGGDDLPRDTWFPVPREGVLGALRTCDLVVPCPGVRSQHLDFSWQDGTGLLIRPRTGCEVLVDGMPVSRRSAGSDAPLVHGSVLQVGTAVLRLQLFAALSHTNRTFVPQAQNPDQVPGSWPVPVVPPAQIPPAESFPWQMQSFPVPPVSMEQPAPQPLQQPSSVNQSVPAQQPAPERRKRAERWKEDWSD